MSSKDTNATCEVVRKRLRAKNASPQVETRIIDAVRRDCQQGRTRRFVVERVADAASEAGLGLVDCEKDLPIAA